jgi:hypothetical protein
MTSPLYLAPSVTRARIANRLYVNKPPASSNAGTTTRTARNHYRWKLTLDDVRRVREFEAGKFTRRKS